MRPGVLLGVVLHLLVSCAHAFNFSQAIIQTLAGTGTTKIKSNVPRNTGIQWRKHSSIERYFIFANSTCF
jgi:hypothetical protein